MFNKVCIVFWGSHNFFLSFLKIFATQKDNLYTPYFTEIIDIYQTSGLVNTVMSFYVLLKKYIKVINLQ